MTEQTFRTTIETINRQIETLKDSIGTGIYEQYSREIDTLENAFDALYWKFDTEGVRDAGRTVDHDHAFEFAAGR